MRLDNWRERLWSEVMRDDVFQWGRRDCFTFVGDCVEAVTGVPVLCDLRDDYHDEESAKRIIERHGGFLSFADILLGGRFAKTDNPDEGDAVAVRIPGVDMFVGGVHLGGTRTGLLVEGKDQCLIAFGLDIVEAWKVD